MYDLQDIDKILHKRIESQIALEQAQNEYEKTCMRPTHKPGWFGGQRVDSIYFYEQKVQNFELQLREHVERVKSEDFSGMCSWKCGFFGIFP